MSSLVLLAHLVSLPVSSSCTFLNLKFTFLIRTYICVSCRHHDLFLLLHFRPIKPFCRGLYVIFLIFKTYLPLHCYVSRITQRAIITD
ncbi:uncharacterized protein EV420DRAFT_1596380 [Desarmillaria tabescens]|uniref:Uncharacterized protein n=1 Tax=Armillaria tabescens TaxID=1929756 RepID=A0AA39J208_ARMTA|nr:uncharacterized protein EV420DRAFT_1596380 [Desarmillaria tabescens]KAK0434676.1 hypothetical protein EV420DRAFT_1596380 [Desarmillaria tabescens]